MSVGTGRSLGVTWFLSCITAACLHVVGDGAASMVPTRATSHVAGCQDGTASGSVQLVAAPRSHSMLDSAVSLPTRGDCLL